MSEPIYGKHTGDLSREDMPSEYLPSAEPWYRPRHRRVVLCVCGAPMHQPQWGCVRPRPES